MAAEPKVLLLDEPAAGCNAVETAEVDAVIQKIAGQGITVVLVEHDMRLVMKISNRIHVLDQGRTLAEGTAAEVRANPAVIAAYLGAHGRRKEAGALLDIDNLSQPLRPHRGAARRCRSTWPPARSSRWSAATAPARPRCCARFPACSRSSGGSIRFHGQPIDRVPPHLRVTLGIAQVPEGRQVFAPLSVEDNLKLGAWSREDAEIAADIEGVYETFPVLREKRSRAGGRACRADSSRCSPSAAR